MPRLSARRHLLRFFLLHTHNLIEQERQVLRSPFMCVSNASHRRPMQQPLSMLRGVLGVQAWLPTHLLIEPYLAHSYLSKLLQTLFQS